MAVFEGSFFSKNLGRENPVSVILPHDVAAEPGWGFPVLYLLHGRGDNSKTWLMRSNIERYATERGLAVVMPNADLSFYCNMKNGAPYLSYIIEELPEMIGRMFHLSYTRERNFIGGISMGGYGAIKCALLSPERFSGCIALSPVTEIQAYVEYTSRKGDAGMWRGIFGESVNIQAGDDLYTLAQNANTFVHICPSFYIACGKQDELYEQNLRFKEHLDACHVDFTFEQANASHEWAFWDAAIQRGLDLMLSKGS